MIIKFAGLSLDVEFEGQAYFAGSLEEPPQAESVEVEGVVLEDHHVDIMPLLSADDINQIEILIFQQIDNGDQY